MLLNSVIIVLREVLEATLIFSILLALSRQSKIHCSWITWSLLIGMFGAVVYGINIPLVSEWFDGVGQEVVNALMQYSVYILLLFYIIILHLYAAQPATATRKLLVIMMILITAITMSREGSEIFRYFLSAIHSDNHYAAIMMGMIIGASIGTSIGVLFYYLLLNIREQWSMNFGLGLLILAAAGLISQATLLMIQADWLPAQRPVWDSSAILSERSLPGQLLYALVGYEATPTALQAGMYLAGLILPVFIILLLKKPSIKKTVK